MTGLAFIEARTSSGFARSTLTGDGDLELYSAGRNGEPMLSAYTLDFT